ncbi:cell division protein FtsL [Candidatus Sumerlaeota bacterium]|nr:cell division protein FtsL [Candidatus Sumerlaeota bacterium]
MTRRRGQTRLTQRRQTLAVTQGATPQRVASVRLTVKLVLWFAFFTALFTFHVHLGLRTAALRAEARRLEHRLQDLRNERRQMSSELTAALDSARIQQIAESELGMVMVHPTQRLRVSARTVAEVEDSVAIWRGGDDSDAHPSGVRQWIETLAGLWPGHESNG